MKSPVSPFYLIFYTKKRGERNLTYTMTQKRQEGEFKSKYIAVNSSRVKEHRTLPEQRFNMGKEGYTLHYWQTPRDPIDTLYTVLDTSRPSIFPSNALGAYRMPHSFCVLGGYFSPLLFPLNFRGRRDPFLLNPAPLYPRYVNCGTLTCEHAEEEVTLLSSETRVQVTLSLSNL